MQTNFSAAVVRYGAVSIPACGGKIQWARAHFLFGLKKVHLCEVFD
jgi:hypothetical protein